MRHHPLFVSRLLNRPQMITPAAGAAVVHALLPGVRLDGYDGESDSTTRNGRDYVVASAVAVIPLVGELVHRGGSMDAMSGVTSYEYLQDMISDALTDPDITGLMLDIDSPGGEAGGNLDFSEWLAQQRGTKPIVAFVNSMACSAAYAIACACDTVLISEDGMAGSIGCVTYHVDLSPALDKAGVITTWIYAGDHKIDGVPTGPLTDQASEEINAIVQTIYNRFCSVVAANRGLSVDAVRGTQAAIFQGQDAVRIGLADNIATYGEALMAAATPRTAPANSRQSLLASTAVKSATPKMQADSTEIVDPVVEEQPKPAPQPDPPKPAEPGVGDTNAPPTPNPPASPIYLPGDPQAVANMCQEAGFPELIAGFLGVKASMDHVKARLGDAKEIKAIAEGVHLPAMAAPIIRSGLTVEEARVQLFAAKAGKDAGLRTDTAPPADRQEGGGKVESIDSAAIARRWNSPRPGNRRSRAA